jgi:nitronate monooxygenase
LGFKLEEIEDSNFTLDKHIFPILKIALEMEERFNRHVPVIAAGGIYTGADIHHFLELRASGVQVPQSQRKRTNGELKESIRKDQQGFQE